MKVIIIGGVAGGASCAARLRRLDEKAEIIIIERGQFISYANCGLPYHVGSVIEKEENLLVANEQMFNSWFSINVRSSCEAIFLSPKEKTIQIKDLKTGEVGILSYDKLVLSQGATPIRPDIKGMDLPGVFQVKTILDARNIREWIEKGTPFLAGVSKNPSRQTKRRKPKAVVVGGGFIGLEMVENLVHRGFDVTLIQLLDQLLAPVDREYARMIEEHLRRNSVSILLNDTVTELKQQEDKAIDIETRSGSHLLADVVILSLGVRPDISLAESAGLAIGERGGIKVDENMCTSEPDIFAVGDGIEVKDFVNEQMSLIALAGPANRQGRIAADAIVGRNSKYRGTQGTAVIGLFGSVIAWTGASEKSLIKLGRSGQYEKVYIYPNSHAGYYPGAKPIAMKIIFSKNDGRILGAQAFGEDGVDKRISVIAAMIQMGASVYDLEETELCYAPQFGSAKDAINFSGMVSANVLRGDMPIAHWNSLNSGILLDVREIAELSVDKVEGAIHIPLGQLRKRISELPPDKVINVFCRSGQRSYLATRILLQNGFDARTISGGILARTWCVE